MSRPYATRELDEGEGCRRGHLGPGPWLRGQFDGQYCRSPGCLCKIISYVLYKSEELIVHPLADSVFGIFGVLVESLPPGLLLKLPVVLDCE